MSGRGGDSEPTEDHLTDGGRAGRGAEPTC